MKRLIIAAALSLGATGAPAHETEWKPYAGASLAQNQFEDWSLGINDDGGFTGGSTDEEGNGFGAVFGVEPYEYLGFELGYHDFGEARLVAQSNGSGTTWEAGPVSQTLSLTSVDISVIGRLPIAGDWVLFGRAGASYYDAEWVVAGTLQPATPVRGTVGENKHQSPVFGAGVEYRGLGAWSLVASYLTRNFERPNTDEESKVDSISLSAVYRW
jgi:hypothetical protein